MPPLARYTRRKKSSFAPVCFPGTLPLRVHLPRDLETPPYAHAVESTRRRRQGRCRFEGPTDEQTTASAWPRRRRRSAPLQLLREMNSLRSSPMPAYPARRCRAGEGFDRDAELAARFFRCSCPEIRSFGAPDRLCTERTHSGRRQKALQGALPSYWRRSATSSIS